MSDLFPARQKVQQGINWRGEITVNIDGEEHQLSVRQLTDPEMYTVMSRIDDSEFDDLADMLDDDDRWDEFTELSEKDSLTDEESARLEELQDELEDSDTLAFFDALSDETFEGIRMCGKHAVVPDDDDVNAIMRDNELAESLEDKHGMRIRSREDAEQAANKEIQWMIDNATQFASFTIGIQALLAGQGDMGN
jgi:hypothetical protein